MAYRANETNASLEKLCDLKILQTPFFFACSIFYSIALQKAAQSLHADTQQLGYGCLYRVQEKKNSLSGHQ